MPIPTSPKPTPDERGLAAVDVEDLGREQPADAEHRDERQEQRHERHAADVEVEDRAEDVVERATVMSSRPPPIRAQTTKMKSSTGIVDHRGAVALPCSGAAAPGCTG